MFMLARSNSLVPLQLRAMQANGVDAVLVGRIEHFWGYADSSAGRQLLTEIPFGLAGATASLAYGTSHTNRLGESDTSVEFISTGIIGGSILLGTLVEMALPRDVAYDVALTARLISTEETSRILWEDRAEERRRLRTRHRNKCKVAVGALRSTANQLVMSIDKSESF